MKTLVAFFILVSLPAGAQTLKVMKVKGSQAIVNVTNGTVQVGQTIRAPQAGGDDDELELTGGSSGPRKHLVGIDVAELSSITNETGSVKSSATQIALKARYGWNHGTMEYGAIGILGMVDRSGSNVTTFGGGGFFDWNLRPNRVGNEMFYGIGIEGTYSSTTAPNGGSGSSEMKLLPSGFMKWFILKTPTALRFDVGYAYSDIDTGGTKTKAQGLLAKAGFAIYF